MPDAPSVPPSASHGPDGPGGSRGSAAVTWLRALRAPSLTAGAMPALVAFALARMNHDVAWLHVVGVFVGLVALQAGVNLVNDLFDDASGLDRDPDFDDLAFPLGSRVLQEGIVTRAVMKRAAIACFAIGAACGVALDFVHPGHTVLGLGLLGFALGYFYTAPPLKIAYRGFGEPITFSLFGPVAGCGAFYVYTGGFAWPAFVVSCVVGLWSMTILFLHHFPQREADARHGKRTPVVRLGHERAGRLVPWMLALPYLLVGGSIVAGTFPFATALVVLTLPIAWRVGRAALTRPAHEKAMAGAAMRTLALHFFGSLALIAGFVLGPLLGGASG